MCIGRLKKNGGQEEQALRRSRGGFSSKIHILVDALGYPFAFILTGGHRHDVSQVEELIDPYKFENAIADKAYDSEDILAPIAKKNAVPVNIDPCFQKTMRFLRRKVLPLYQFLSCAGLSSDRLYRPPQDQSVQGQTITWQSDDLYTVNIARSVNAVWSCCGCRHNFL